MARLSLRLIFFFFGTICVHLTEHSQGKKKNSKIPLYTSGKHKLEEITQKKKKFGSKKQSFMQREEQTKICQIHSTNKSYIYIYNSMSLQLGTITRSSPGFVLRDQSKTPNNK